MRSLPIAVLVLLLLAATAPAEQVRMHRLPEGALHPQAAIDDAGRVHLIYFMGEARAGDIYYIRSNDSGATWSEPIRVNSMPNTSMVSGTVRGPHLAIGRDGWVHVAWMGAIGAQPQHTAHGGDGQHGQHGGHAQQPQHNRPMYYARLRDGDDAFQPQRNVIQQRPGLDGGGSIAADRSGNVYVAWHAPTDAGPGEQNRGVWITHSSDDGTTFTTENLISPEGTGVCACCSMRIFSTNDGRLAFMYRTAVDRVDRDAMLLVSNETTDSFTTVVRHPWKVGQCVMSTFAFAQSRADLLAAWETLGQIHWTRVNPASQQAPTPIAAPGSGQRKHPALAANDDGRVLLAWVEWAGWNRSSALAWQVYDVEGKPIPEQRGNAAGVPANSLPTAFPTPEGFVIVY